MRLVRAIVPTLALLAASVAAQEPAHARAAARDFVVIVNAANPISSIERDDLSRMFFKRLVKWPGGAAVEPIDLSPQQSSRVEFTTAVHRKPVSAVRAFWQQQIFSGRNVPPPEKRSDTDVVDYVRQHPGAVGYISPSQQLEKGVKTIDIKGIAQ